DVTIQCDRPMSPYRVVILRTLSARYRTVARNCTTRSSSGSASVGSTLVRHAAEPSGRRRRRPQSKPGCAFEPLLYVSTGGHVAPALLSPAGADQSFGAENGVRATEGGLVALTTNGEVRVAAPREAPSEMLRQCVPGTRRVRSNPARTSGGRG